MILKENNTLLVFGMFSLTVAILIGRYIDSFPLKDFVEGLFYGISITSNLAYLIKLRLKNK